MDDEQRVEAALKDLASEAFERSPIGDHLDDEVIAQHLDEHRAFDERQLTHLRSCGECRDAVGIAASDLPLATNVVLFSRRTWAIAAMAAAAGLAGIITVGQLENSSWKTKGRGVELGASVTLLAIDTNNARRGLESGDVVTKTERIAFLYGNPTAEFTTITILGFNGGRVFWYYPEAPGPNGTPIDGGPKTLSIRLPFDVTVDDHEAGELTIVGAFDQNPMSLAARLESGEDLSDLFVTRLRIDETAP